MKSENKQTEFDFQPTACVRDRGASNWQGTADSVLTEHTKRKPMSRVNKTDILKLKVAYAQAVGAYLLIGVITVGGFVCMGLKVDGGQLVVANAISVLTGLFIGRRYHYGQ